MDDTTDYYMHYDAQVLSEHYQITDSIEEFDKGHKEYYWGYESLPTLYKDLIVNDYNLLNPQYFETLVFQSNNKFIYILPYYVENKEETFFVVHLFDLKNEAVFYQAWQNTFLGTVLIVLVVLVYYIIITNRQITRQVRDFHLWVNALSSNNLSQLKNEKLPINITFEELVDSGNCLQLSLINQYQLQENEQKYLARERHFLSSLSHEIRTPISIISAAVSILNQRKDITQKDKEILSKLGNANQNMKQLTHVILQLWRGQQPMNTNSKTSDDVNSSPNSLFLLDELIEVNMESCLQQYEQTSLNFITTLSSGVKLFSQFELANMLIKNLLNNACQYTDDGEVIIELNHHALYIKNTFEKSLMGKKNSHCEFDADIQYGYGLGLFIVNKICEQQSWRCKMNVTDHAFTVEVIFKDATR